MSRRAHHETAVATLALLPLLVGACSDRRSGVPGAPYGRPHADAVSRIEYQEGRYRLSGGWQPLELAPAEPPPTPFETALPFLAELTGPRIGASGFEDLAAAGNLLAALGMAERALSPLEAAWLLAPSDARVLNDFGVALQESAGTRPEAQVRALELFDRAVQADPNLLPARFNLALALESLFLRAQAAREWELVLQQEPFGDWARLARRYQEGLALASGLRPALDPSRLEDSDPSVLAAGAAEHPHAARRLLEGELLERWARAASSGSLEAELWLDRSQAMAEALVDRTGDRLALDIWRALRRSSSSREPKRAAQPVQLYLEGMRLRAEERCDLAQPVLLRASRELSRAENPLDLLAELYAGACASRRTSAGDIPIFSNLLQRISGMEYGLLRARIDWMLGLRAASRSEPVTALALRERALSGFQAAGEWEMVSVLQGMMADSLLTLGRVEESWSLRIDAFRRSGGDPETVSRLLPTAAEVCRQMGFPRAALRFRSEEIQLAERAGSPIALAEGLSGRGALHFAAGEPGPAREDLRLALEVAERVPDESTRQYVSSQASVVLATVLREDEPLAALQAVDDALQRRERSELRVLLPETYLERARILRRLGSLDDAVESLETALELIEVTRDRLEDRELRVSYFEKSREIFDELVSMELLRRAPPHRLLGILARAQARGLADALSRATAATLAERAEDYSRSLPASSLLLVYYQLPDALLCLRHHRGELTAHRLPALKPEDHEALVDATRNVGAGAGEAPRHAKGWREDAFERLLRPVWPAGWERGGELIVVPDGLLAQLPFAAIIDPATRRPLVLDHPVRLLPGLATGPSSTARSRRAPNSVLAVGDPAFDPALAPGLTRLPSASTEAREIVASAPRGATLLALEATEEALATRLPAFEALHLATHAVTALDPRFSHLLLAPSPATDGVLYAHELERFDFRRTRLVVLSSCSTAAGPSDRLEGPLTLARSLLAQGVPEVVAALWPVEDRATRLFMNQFYARLWAGADASEALAGAQAWAIASGELEIARPASWAAFQLIGGASRLTEGRDLP